MTPIVTMRQALEDPHLLGSMLPGRSWLAWRALLIGSRGEALTAEELEHFRLRTGREGPPGEPVSELAIVSGRRSGKTAASATLAIYLSVLCDWRDVVRRGGERGTLLFLAQSQRTARIAFRYAKHAFETLPYLRQEVVSTTQETISLRNGVDLEIRPASFRGLRGMTAIGVVADEIAFWFNEETSANPDREILAAVRPALAMTRGPVIMVSSPYAKRGELWETFRRHHGPQGSPRILVAQGASRDWNETLPADVVERALQADPETAEAEYLGRFRSDISSYVTYETVMKCVEAGVVERPPVPGPRYWAYTDAAGGSGADSWTLAVAHKEGVKAIVDVLYEQRPPFDPIATVADLVAVLKQYGVGSVWGDKYAGGFPAATFLKLGIGYMAAPLTTSRIYQDFLPQLNAGRVVLPDNERLIAQLTSLERRTGRGGGMDVIDHPPGGHDDAACAVAGAVLALGFGDVIKAKPAPEPPPEPWRYDIRVGELFGVAGEPDRRPGRGDGRIRL